MYNTNFDKEFHNAFMLLSENERIQVAVAILDTMFSGNIPSIGNNKVFAAFARLCPRRLKELCPYFWVAMGRTDIFSLNNRIEDDMLDKLILDIQKKAEAER